MPLVKIFNVVVGEHGNLGISLVYWVVYVHFYNSNSKCDTYLLYIKYKNIYDRQNTTLGRIYYYILCIINKYWIYTQRDYSLQSKCDSFSMFIPRFFCQRFLYFFVASPNVYEFYSPTLTLSCVWAPFGWRWISACRADVLWGPSSLLFNGHWRSLPVVKRSGRGVNHWPPSSADVKNEWSCTSSPCIRFRGVNRDDCTFYQYCLCRTCNSLHLNKPAPWLYCCMYQLTEPNIQEVYYALIFVTSIGVSVPINPVPSMLVKQGCHKFWYHFCLFCYLLHMTMIMLIILSFFVHVCVCVCLCVYVCICNRTYIPLCFWLALVHVCR
jgi:hypothetical protein